jgi:hypothetical protein
MGFYLKEPWSNEELARLVTEGKRDARNREWVNGKLILEQLKNSNQMRLG